MHNQQLIERLNQQHKLSHAQWEQLIATYQPADAAYAQNLAHQLTVARFGRKIFFRGIIEYTNYCKNDCRYCGIRHSNPHLKRYRLSEAQILACCAAGYENGFRTFVIQGGEDPYFTDQRLVPLLRHIRQQYPDCAITLSLGERSYQSYQRLFAAGADRYLLRHETACQVLYEKWHPARQTFANRRRCLWQLKAIGYQVGCGMMVGAPFQTVASLADDMVFITKLQPQMLGLGPFIPHSQTPFRHFAAGNTQLTTFILSLCRILKPDVLLPATTALGTVESNGRQQGVLAGCNVVMPNLSPLAVRKQYLLYDNKAGVNENAASGIQNLTDQMAQIHYTVLKGRGDFQPDSALRRNEHD